MQRLPTLPSPNFIRIFCRLPVVNTQNIRWRSIDSTRTQFMYTPAPYSYAVDFFAVSTLWLQASTCITVRLVNHHPMPSLYGHFHLFTAPQLTLFSLNHLLFLVHFSSFHFNLLSIDPVPPACKTLKFTINRLPVRYGIGLTLSQTRFGGIIGGKFGRDNRYDYRGVVGNERDIWNC